MEFGRLAENWNSAYVSTNGGATQSEIYDFTMPGGIVKVDAGAAGY